MIVLDVALPLPRFELRVRVELTGRATAVLGPSGSGKTSLLEVIAGLRGGASGRIVLGSEILLDADAGVSLPPERRRIGYVPQDALLFPHLTVEENVRFGARGADTRAFDEAVAMLEIGALLGRHPATLSGGERQRVALARAIATSPRLLLLDEPLAAVDTERRERILPYLLRVRDALRVPLLYVTHNAGEAEAVADEALLLRDGRLVRHGPTRTLLRSGMPAAADPEWRVENIVAGVIVDAGRPGDVALLRAGASDLHVPSSEAAAAGERVLYAVSPDEIVASTVAPDHVSARNVLHGRVVAETEEQTGRALRVAAGGLDWNVRLTRSAADELHLVPGAEVWLAIKSHAFRSLR